MRYWGVLASRYDAGGREQVGLRTIALVQDRWGGCDSWHPLVHADRCVYLCVWCCHLSVWVQGGWAGWTAY